MIRIVIDHIRTKIKGQPDAAALFELKSPPRMQGKVMHMIREK